MFHLYGIVCKWNFNAAVSSHTRIGITLTTGQKRNGFRNHAVEHATQCQFQSSTRVPVDMKRMIVESMFSYISNWYSVQVTRNFSLFLPCFHYNHLLTHSLTPSHILYRKQRPDMFWNQGCAKALQMKIIQNLHVIGIVAIVIAFFQVITFSIDVDCRDEIFSVASNNHQVNLILSHTCFHCSSSVSLLVCCYFAR